MISLTRNIIFPSVGIISVLAIIGSLNASGNYLISFLIFLNIITIPGFLILLSLRIHKNSMWEYISFTVGLSLFFLMVPGVIFNLIWDYTFPTSPLEQRLLINYFGILVLILAGIAYWRSKSIKLKYKINITAVFKKWYFLIPPIITVLASAGAISLNNTGNNTVAITTVSLMTVVMLITIFLHRRINVNFYPWSLYFFSLALLLMLSLRSNYVSGWDIQNEFKVFQVTKTLGAWNPINWKDAYNACLSITLLPTIISKLTSFPDDYIYKFFYQVIFAFTPVILFQTFKRYTTPILSYLAIIYIISQPLFIQPMTALMRQEIAFLFFTLMMFSFFEGSFTWKIRSILVIIFGTGMIVSHYSTTYVALLLLFATFPLMGVFRLLEHIPFISKFFRFTRLSDGHINYKYYLNPLLMVILLGITFFWYGPVNNQLGQVQKVALDGINRMHELFNREVKTAESQKAVTFLNSDQTTVEELQVYTKSILSQVGGDSLKLYSPDSPGYSSVFPLSSQFVIPKVTMGNREVQLTLEVLKQILKFCVIFGPIYLFIRYFRKAIFPREYIVYGAVSSIFIVIMTFHPAIAEQYNLSRMYLQLLFYLSLPAVLLISIFFAPLRKLAIYVIGILILVLFIYLSGFTYQFLGGEARMLFNNYGADYDKFFVHEEELASAQWLDKTVNNKSTLFADQESNLRIYRLSTRSMNMNIIPALIYKDAYVYGNYSNVVNNRTSIYSEGSPLIFTFPHEFLDKNKNLIYSNGGSKIYR